MSNLIKSHYISVGDNKKIIDSDNSFHLLKGCAMKVAVDEHVEANNTNDNNERFTDGLNVLSMQRLVAEEEELLTKKADDLIEDARLKAEAILDEANREADRIRQLASEEGKRLGYTEGMEQGQSEILAIQQELNEQVARNNEELNRMANALEPQFVTVVVNLLEHLTGVVVEENKDVISYLIQQAIAGVEKCKAFTVKLSKEDYEFVRTREEAVLSGLSEDFEIQFIEETTFVKNQCMIESADGRLIDCSLDMQLKTLITDLKMLAGI